MLTHAGITNWRRKGVVPSGWHLRLFNECKRKGIEFDLCTLFGLSADDAARVRLREHPSPREARGEG